MEKKNLLIDSLPKEFKKEVIMFCKLNEIDDPNGLLLSCLKGGFAIEKFGRTPISGEVEVIEKEVEKEIIKEVEKIIEKEIPVEKIVERIVEVPVEKIIEVEKVITDNTKIEEYSEKLNSFMLDNERLKDKVNMLETDLGDEKKLVDDSKNFKKDNDVLRKHIKILTDKIKEYEGVLEHFKKYSNSSDVRHLKSSNLNDELYKQ